jgi:hypothetical protein
MPLTFQRLKCWSCDTTMYTFNALATHHLEQHERLLPADVMDRPVWVAQAPLTRFQPPNYKAQAAPAWHTNGLAASQEPAR